jgi:lipopolysaccharide transport system permease protein
MNAQTLELLYLLVRKDLKVRYKSSVLGYLWALANPFAFAFVYWVAFKYIMRVQMENYSLYLIAGIFPWLWLANGVTQATRSYHVNASLVKKVRIPRGVLPLSSVVQEMMHFLFALPVIVAFLVFAGTFEVRAAWLWQLPLMLSVQLAFVYPLAMVLAISNVYVHDIEHLAGLGFAMLFFLTPMVYPVTMVPESLRPWFDWNPLHALMASWRGVFFSGTLDVPGLAYAVACAGALAALAWAFHRRFGPRIPELL